MRVRFSFGAKIAVLVITLTAGMGIAIAVVVDRVLSQTLHHEYESQASGVVRNLAISAEELLVADARTALQGKIEQYRAMSGVRYIVVLDGNGEVVAHTLSPTFPPALSDALRVNRGLAGENNDEPVSAPIEDVPEVGRVLDVSKPILLGVLGSAHVGMDLSLIEGQVAKTMWALAGVIIAFALAGSIASFVAGRMLAAPIRDLVRATGRVAAGELDTQTHPRTRSEFPTLADGFDGMVLSLRQIAIGMRRGSENVNQAATKILQSTQSQEAGIVEQSAGLEEVATSVRALSGTADAITEQARALSTLGGRMSDQMSVARGSVDAVRATIFNAAGQSEQVAQQVMELYEQMRSIRGVVDIIDAISDRLDVLALNAALEGARAGELGKGFALVADEMRRLAENVSNSTREVKETLQLVQQSARAASASSDSSAVATRAGVREVESMVEVTQQMFSLISQAASASQQILVITQQQHASAAQVAGTMADIGDVASQARNLAEDTTVAANDLVEVAEALRRDVERFHLV